MKRTSLALIAMMIAILVSFTACGSKAPAPSEQPSGNAASSGEPLPAGPVSPDEDIPYSTYTNTVYSFSVPYPSYFETVVESDSGDGATFTTADKAEELKIWAQYNIDNLTGQAMLDEAKSRVSQIVMENAEDDSFYILYQGSNGAEGGVINFFEYGYIKNGIIVRLLFRYPVELESQYDDIIKQMTVGLTFDSAEIAEG